MRRGGVSGSGGILQVASIRRHARLPEEEWRYDEALASLEAALAVKPDDAETLCICGNLPRTLRRYDEALRCYAGWRP
jgi:tetratricopeptide (TPR) repeat protein